MIRGLRWLRVPRRGFSCERRVVGPMSKRMMERPSSDP
jgi:hypothetical protein